MSSTKHCPTSPKGTGRDPVQNSSALVLRADTDGVATLTLNRPDKLNALNMDVFRALRAHLDDIADAESVLCVVISGAGRSFSAGHDLDALAAGPYDPTFEAETVDALELLPQPVIAAIRGHCFTGGLELALGCDLLIATESAQFADTHGKWGLVPVWGLSVRLPERVGMANAKMMMFTSQRMTSARGLAIGLVDEVVGDDDLDGAVAALAAQIRANSRGSNRILKKLLRDGLGVDRQDLLNRERALPYGVPEDMAERLTGPI
jgi:enoyl-CoA hydratase/carnithine racemase